MIKGITDRPSLAEAGKIKIGGLGEERQKKDKSGTYRIPVKYDHFTITKTTRDVNELLEIDTEIMNGLISEYGEPNKDGEIVLKKIPIVLHSDEIEEVFPTRYAYYHGRRCLCHGDGEAAQQAVIESVKGKKEPTGEFRPVKCPCNLLSEKKCKPNGKLFCSIVAPGSSIAGAVHIWRTTSVISIRELTGSLIQIKELAGFLRGLPLWLKIGQKTVEPDGKAITVYTCHVELRESDILKLQKHALEQAKMRAQLGGTSGYRALLSAPGDNESLEEQAAIEAEFYVDDPEDPPPPSKKEKGTSADDISKELKAKKETTETEADTKVETPF
jgi:hypothetical protein